MWQWSKVCFKQWHELTWHIPLISSLTEKTEFMNLHKRNACVYMSSVSLLIPLLFFVFPSGQGLLSQSALQLNNQDAYAAAGYHSNQGLTLGETVMGSGGQVGGAVHSYNQVHTWINDSVSLPLFLFSPFFPFPLPSFFFIFLQHPASSHASSLPPSLHSPWFTARPLLFFPLSHLSLHSVPL